MNPKLKVLIPNILTLTKLVCIPFIIIFSILKLNIVSLIFLFVAIISNILDHVMAKKWNTETNIGTKMDYISNEIFLVVLLLFLTTRFYVFSLMLIIECLIVMIDLIAYYKMDLTKDLKINIVKKVLFNTCIILGFVYLLNRSLSHILNGVILMSANIGLLTLINYITSYYDSYKNKELEESINNDKDVEKNKRTKIYDIEEADEKKEPEDDKDSDTKVLKKIKDIFVDDEDEEDQDD